MEPTYFCQRTIIHANPSGSITGYLKKVKAGGYRQVSRWKDAEFFESLVEAQVSVGQFVDQTKRKVEGDLLVGRNVKKMVFHLVCIKGSSFAAAQTEILSTTFVNVAFDEEGNVSFKDSLS